MGIFSVMTMSAAKPFALEKLEFLKNHAVQSPAYIKSYDSCKLAYYAFVPESPKAMVIFYHGAGFYGSTLYQYFAQQLAKHAIGCYLFDIRGHGNSEGDRGDGPSKCMILDDVRAAVDYVKKLYPDVPLYLGGHSSGAGLVLNYGEHLRCSKKNHAKVAGYIFVAPYLGRNSGVFKEHTDPTTSFIKHVRSWVFIFNGLSGGHFFSHTPAVYFNYPKDLIKSDPKIVTSYTPTMTAATSPENPQELFRNLDKPFCLLVAADDEQFIAQKIVDYKNYVEADLLKKSDVQIMDNTKHLDILLSAADACAQFMAR